MTQHPRDGSHTSKRTRSTPGLVISTLSTFTRRRNGFVPIVSRIFPKLVLHVAVHVLVFLSVLGVADADPIASSSSHPKGSCVRGSSSISSVSGSAAFVSYSDLWTSDRPKPARINIPIPSQRYDRACFSTRSSTLNLKERPDINLCTSTRTHLFRTRRRNREISKRTFASNGSSNGCDYGFNGFNWFKKNEHIGRFAFPMFSTRLGASANVDVDVDVDLETTLKTVAKKKVKRKRKRKATIPKKNGATISATTNINTITLDDDAPTIKKKKKTKRKTRTSTAKKRSTSTAVRKKATAKKKKSKRSRSSRKIKDEPVHFFRNETDAITILNYNHNHDLDIDQSKSSTPTVVKFKVRGNPVPLARHRTYRGFVFNPSAKKQKQFCNVVLDMLPFCHFNGNESAIIVGNGGSDSPDIIDKGIIDIDLGIDTDTNIDIDVNKNSMNIDTNIDISKGTDNVIPIFGEQEVISVQIISRMKRPQKHFVGGKPERGRLRKPKPVSENGEKGDTDNQAPHVASHLQVTRTDVDNLAKFVLDALNGVLYADDRQVASLTVTKVYDDEEPYVGSTDVCIKSLTLEDLSLNGVLDGEG